MPVEPVKIQNIDDTFELIWVSAGTGDNMRGLAVVECDDGLSQSRYGTTFPLNDDDGYEIISMRNFIFDDSTDNQGIDFITGTALIMLQELLNQLSAGNIDPDFLLKKIEANPAESACNIRLFIQRQREGVFDDAFDGGSIIGSRSTEIQLRYTPVAPLIN